MISKGRSAPPTAYELALSAVTVNVRNAMIASLDQPTAPSPGEAGQADEPKLKGRPTLTLYMVNNGLRGVLCRRVQQIVLYTVAPPKYNNANNGTRPNFRVGLAARYFDVRTVNVSKKTTGPVTEKQAPTIIIHDAEGKEVARVSATAIASGRLYETMLRVLRDHGWDVRDIISRGSGMLVQLFRVEIEIAKLKRRRGPNIKRLLNEYQEVRDKSLVKYRELLQSTG